MTEYVVRELTGNENIEFRSRKKIPLSVAILPLQNGKPLVVQGMRKSTAYYFRKKLENVLKKKVEIEHVWIDGQESYIFTTSMD